MSCIRANVPITIVEGGTYNKTFQWKTGTPSVAVDLTDYTARMQVRAKIKDVDSILDIEFQTEDWTPDGSTGIYLYDGVAIPADKGKWRIYIKDDDTEGLCPAHKDITGVYDLFLYNSSNEAVLQQYGVATIVAAVTRDEQ